MARSSLSFETPNVISVFLSWMNLEMCINFCLYEGMDTYWKTWLELAFPMYVIVLVVMVIFLSEHYEFLMESLTLHPSFGWRLIASHNLVGHIHRNNFRQELNLCYSWYHLSWLLTLARYVGSLTANEFEICLLYTSPSPRDATLSRMPSSA